ncbi:MAG: glycosyltransferase family 2 protein [Candidatus Thermoplasmatota archaeon]
MRVLCAIPCLNEEVAIGSVVLRARRHATEVVVVDDGSSDSTATVAELAGATVLRHPQNQGKGAAYSTLWRHAVINDFDALVVIDGDGQHDPDEIPLLVARLEAGDDFVIGARWGDATQMPLWRRIGKRVLDYSTAAAASGGTRTNLKLTDSQSGFRGYSKAAMKSIEPEASGFGVESQLLVDAVGKGLSISEVRIHCRYDVDGSTERPVQHATKVLNSILIQVGVVHPILTLAMPGFVSLVIGMGMGAYAGWLYTSQAIFAPGWVLLSMLAIIAGIIGIFTGLILNVLPTVVERSVKRTLPGR